MYVGGDSTCILERGAYLCMALSSYIYYRHLEPGLPVCGYTYCSREAQNDEIPLLKQIYSLYKREVATNKLSTWRLDYQM
jgi:hypothetical protein